MNRIANTTAPIQRLEYVDGCRGLAVAVVIIFHALIWSRVALPVRLDGLIAMVGCAGVDLFLVISGFCLTWPLVKSQGDVKAIDLKKFAVRRITRIFPPYLIAFAIAVGTNYLTMKLGVVWWSTADGNVFNHSPREFLASIVSHLFLLHGLTPFSRDADGAFWSLSLEWQFYILFPLLILVARKTSILTAFIVTVAATLSFRVGVKLVDNALVWNALFNETALARWCEFGMGMLLAKLVSTSSIKLRSFQRDAIAFSIFLAVIAVGFLRPTFFLGPILWGLVGASILLTAANSSTMFGRLTRRPELVWLGDRSYSLYLIHGSVFGLIAIALVKSQLSAPLIAIVFFIFAPALAVIAASILYRFTELPVLRMRRESGLVVVMSPTSTMAIPEERVSTSPLVK